VTTPRALRPGGVRTLAHPTHVGADAQLIAGESTGSAFGWHHGRVQNWEIRSVVAVSPTHVDDSDAAYLLKVAYGDEQAEVVVEFAAPSSVASSGYAEEVVRRFLADDEPPQRIVVERDGSVRIASSPLTAERAPRSTGGSREPQRARRRSQH
jgi:hypothetical protein